MQQHWSPALLFASVGTVSRLDILGRATRLLLGCPGWLPGLQRWGAGLELGSRARPDTRAGARAAALPTWPAAALAGCHAVYCVPAHALRGHKAACGRLSTLN
jgi:hypothetical protein